MEVRNLSIAGRAGPNASGDSFDIASESPRYAACSGKNVQRSTKDSQWEAKEPLLARESRPDFPDTTNQRLQLVGDAPVQDDGEIGVFLQYAAKHLPVQPQHLRIDGGGCAGQSPCIGDQVKLAKDGARPRMADRDAGADLLAVKNYPAAHHHIGRVSHIVLAVELALRREIGGFGAEGEQAQLFGREAFEKPHAGQDADIVIQRHQSCPRTVRSYPPRATPPRAQLGQ